MKENTGTKPLWLSILRWGARIIAILFVAFFLMMFIGEGGFWNQPKGAPLGARDYIILSLWGLFMIGLIIGLWREGLGGLISFIFLLAHIIVLKVEGSSTGIYFYLMLIPSILFLSSWYFHRRAETS